MDYSEDLIKRMREAWGQLVAQKPHAVMGQQCRVMLDSKDNEILICGMDGRVWIWDADQFETQESAQAYVDAILESERRLTNPAG